MNKELEVIVHPSARVKTTVTFKGRGRVIINSDSFVEDYVLFDTGESDTGVISVGSRAKLKQGVIVRAYDGHVSIGKRTSVGEYSILAGHGGLTIGDSVIVAGHCYISAADHIFASDVPIRFQGETAYGIIINDGAWLGARCTVLDGVEIGTGCVIGASSLVTSDLSAKMVCYGIPCKEIYKRNERR